MAKQSASELRARGHAWLTKCSPWITLFSDLCIYGSFIIFYVFNLAKIDYESFAKWVPHYGGLAVNYKGYQYSRMYGYYVLNNILGCSPLMGGAILVTATRRLPKGSPQRALSWFKVASRRLLYHQLPPRRFFSWWCGGITVLDATLVILYVTANAYWCLYSVASTRRSTVLPLKRVGIVGEHPPFYSYLETFALEAGLALYWSLWLLFLPLPHSSFLQTLTGIDYAGMIRYHRWLGHGTMVMTSLHALGYYVLWAYEDQFLFEFRDWSSHDSLNLLAGSISWFGGLLLWATSFDWVRRNHFEFFYGVHLFGFVVYVVFACIHWQGSWNMFVPGALLWMVDLVFRQASYATVTTVAGAKVNETENTADITLLHSKRSSCPISHVYLLIPSISRFQWHPFTVRAQDKEGGLHVSLKDSGSFTRELLDRLARREPVEMRVLAPPHRMAHEWEDHDSVVIAAGGVGVTGAWAALAAMALERAERKSAGKSTDDLPRSVHVIWTARSADEFFTIERWVAEALEDPDRWLRLTLHCTAKSPLGAKVSPSQISADGSKDGATIDFSPAHSDGADDYDRDAGSDKPAVAKAGAGSGIGDGAGSDAARKASSSSDGGESVGDAAPRRVGSVSSAPPSAARRSSGAPAESPRAASLPGTPAAGPVFAKWNASPLFFNALRRVQPGGSGDMVWVLTHALVFFGGFMAVLCVESYYVISLSTLALDPSASDKSYYDVYWKQGLLNMFGLIVGGIGFPFLTLIAPMHVARYVKDRYWHNASELVSPYCLPDDAGCIVTDTSVRIGDTDVVLPIYAGRPDLRTALAEAEGNIVGVYASGPETMNHALRCAANGGNKLFGRTHYDYRKLTTML